MFSDFSTNIEKLTNYFISPAFFASLFILVATLVIFFVIKHLTNKRKKITLGNDGSVLRKETYVRLLLSILKWLVLIIGIFLILGANGINVTSLAAGLGIASAIVGLALQDFLKDIIMGANIVSGDFFSIGDVIKYKDEMGVVISFSMRNTKIRSLITDDTITISNRNISEIAKVGSWLGIDVSVDFLTDRKEIAKMLVDDNEKIKKIEHVFDSQYLGIGAFDNKSVTHKFCISCDPKFVFAIDRKAKEIIYDDLVSNKIKMAPDSHNIISSIETEKND